MRGSGQDIQASVPHDIEAEKSVLSSVFYDHDLFDRVAVKLKSDDFFSSANREVFLAMNELSVEGVVISRMSVADHLQKEGKLEAIGGLPYLSELVEYETTVAALEYILESVKKLALKRKLIVAGQSIVQEAMTSRSDVQVLLAEAELKLAELLQDKTDDSAVELEKIIAEVFNDIRNRIATGNTILGVKSGFAALDDLVSGFNKGNLIIMAARPSMGKTALALNIAMNAAQKYDQHVLVFSLEMSREELGFRLLSTVAGIDGKRLRQGLITKREMDTFMEAVKKLSSCSIIVDDTPAITLSEVRNKARRFKKEGRCDFIVVDYLQLVRGSGSRSSDSREQEIAEISRGFKAIAKELEVPVMALSQLNRQLESRKDKRPMLSDLRESGAIEQDADVIIFIYREEYYDKATPDKGIAELIVGKQRNGPVGTARVAFQPDFARFVNLAMDDDMSPTV